jgi:uncharacterized cofD-like protein
MNKQQQEHTPKVVVIGGGTGLSVLLRGLKRQPIDITAIVTVADDGGSSGRLREELDMPPPGDIRNVIAALSEVEPLVEELFQHRFESGTGLVGHSLGNLLLAAMKNITGDFVTGIQEVSKVLNVRGKVLPAANQRVVLCAKMADGTIVEGESKIPLEQKKIDKVYLKPNNIEALPESLRAINDADLIVIGPGSLYTSILPSLLVPKIADHIIKSKAPKVYVCNVMTQIGETIGYKASDHLQALLNHLGTNFIDTIVVNSEEIPDDLIDVYGAKGQRIVTYDENRLKTFSVNVISDKITYYHDGLIRHNAQKLSNILMSLLPKQK